MEMICEAGGFLSLEWTKEGITVVKMMIVMMNGHA